MQLPRFLRWLNPRRTGVATFPCPLCGEPVRKGALGCRACGSDAETGWSATGWEDGADTGDDPGSFDYEAYLAREFSGGGGRRVDWKRGAMVVLAVAMALSLILFGR